MRDGRRQLGRAVSVPSHRNHCLLYILYYNLFSLIEISNYSIYKVYARYLPPSYCNTYYSLLYLI
jgi:hypothetical protein